MAAENAGVNLHSNSDSRCVRFRKAAGAVCGRTPQITSGAGRNHWARAWSTVLAGGGIRGGQVIGRTDRNAAAVQERPIRVNDFLGTICTILGIDPTRENRAPGSDRPIPIVDSTKPVEVISELVK